jgi:hypothetical protein
MPANFVMPTKLPWVSYALIPRSLHQTRGLGRRVLQRKHHGLEAGAGVGAQQAGARERSQGAGRILDGQAHLGRDEA